MELSNVLSFMAGLCVIGVVCALMALLIRSGTLTLNQTFGIKTKHTMFSDEAWDAGHRAALPTLWWLVWGAGAALAAAAVLCLCGALQSAFVVTASGYAWVLVCLLFSTKRANDAAKRSHFDR